MKECELDQDLERYERSSAQKYVRLRCSMRVVDSEGP